MNRRKFLKSAGLTTAALFVAPSLPAAGQGGRQLVEAEILGQAEARIEKQRKADSNLQLTLPDGKPVPAGTKVTIEQTRHAFLFGCNIFELNRCKTPADNEGYAKSYAELLNYATLPFYWWAYEQQQGKCDYARSEEILAWCKDNNITTKGHPLAWNWVDPKWLPNDTDEVMKLQIARIEDCVGRFKGKIDIWDVVNEATHYDRQECRQGAPKLTAAIDKTGVPEYLRGCFNAARKANAGATLLINDYRTDGDYGTKVISQLVEGDKALYNVIGIQSHQHGGAWPATKIREVCERFAKFGRPLHFTETTFLSGKPGWELGKTDPNHKWESTPEGEARQADDVEKFYTVLFSHPAVGAITWWDFSDQGAWQGAPAGLVRRDMSPKPAYEKLKHLIKEKWWTREEATATGESAVSFRGFLGDYKITAHLPGRTLSGAFSMSKMPAASFTVRLT